MKSRLRNFRYLILLPLFFITSSNNNSIKKPQIASPQIKLTLDSGHTNETNLAKIPTWKGRKKFDFDNDYWIEEYEINDKVAHNLEIKLWNDPLIEYIRTKIKGNYTGGFIKSLNDNDSLLTRMANRKRLPKEPEPHLPDSSRKKVYNIGLYAENNTDLLMSLHFNMASWKNNYDGFHIIISPNNEKYKESLSLARIISKHFQNKGHEISDYMYEDPLKDTPDSLLDQGIVIRNLAAIGDPGHKLKIPAVLIECGWLENYADASDKEIRELSNIIYGSLQEYTIKNNFDGNLYK